jgi:glycosyltransferase involved in cell wall biosynthesis
MRPRLAVLIPCWEEGLTIAQVIKDCRAVLPSATIYVYDNHSTDQTARRARRAGAIVKQGSFLGKGKTVARMFRDIKADCYCLIDGDNTYPVQCLPLMSELITRGQADMVIADRFSTRSLHPHQPFFNYWGNLFTTQLINLLFRGHVNDVQTGCRALSAKFVQSFPARSQGFELETELTIHALAHHFSIINLPIIYRDRCSGSQSKLKTFPDGLKAITCIFRLFWQLKLLPLFSFHRVNTDR